MPTINPGAIGSPEANARRQIEENPESILSWLTPRMLGALLPLVHKLGAKLIVRWITLGGMAMIAMAEHTGYAASVGTTEKVLGALVIVAGWLFDWLLSIITFRLHLVPKAPLADDDEEDGR